MLIDRKAGECYRGRSRCVVMYGTRLQEFMLSHASVHIHSHSELVLKQRIG